jgi:hypothetical protein
MLQEFTVKQLSPRLSLHASEEMPMSLSEPND